MEGGGEEEEEEEEHEVTVEDAGVQAGGGGVGGGSGVDGGVGGDVDEMVDEMSMQMQTIDNSVSSHLGNVAEMCRQMEMVSRLDVHACTQTDTGARTHKDTRVHTHTHTHILKSRIRPFLCDREMLLNIQAPSEMTSVGSQTCWGSASRMDDDDDDYELVDDDEAAGERYMTESSQ